MVKYLFCEFIVEWVREWNLIGVELNRSLVGRLKMCRSVFFSKFVGCISHVQGGFLNGFW
jgi:hypothetical protein